MNTTLRTITHAEYLAEAIDRFGEDKANWAYVCPSCGIVTTGQEHLDALAANPRLTKPGGVPVDLRHVLGQECIGRSLGALADMDRPYEGRGCDRVAYGLIHAPLAVEIAGDVIYSFEFAEVPA